MTKHFVLYRLPDHWRRRAVGCLMPQELLDSCYIHYTFWSELSVGSRSPRVAAERILVGQVSVGSTQDRSRETFLAIADDLRTGATVPPLILVGANDGGTRVVLEGHSRLTTCAIAPETNPNPITVLLGRSPDIAKWDEYLTRAILWGIR